jgi:hypothetical protein
VRMATFGKPKTLQARLTDDTMTIKQIIT